MEEKIAAAAVVYYNTAAQKEFRPFWELGIELLGTKENIYKLSRKEDALRAMTC